MVHPWWLPSKSTVYRVGNINNLTVKKPDKYYFTQVIKVNIWIDKSYWWYAQLILEQHRLALFGYTYTQIYFSINTTILHDLGWVESRDAKQWIWRADSGPWEPTDFGICSRSWNQSSSGTEVRLYDWYNENDTLPLLSSLQIQNLV